MDLGKDLLALALITLALAATATSMGLLLAALAKTQQQIGGLSTLLLQALDA